MGWGRTFLLGDIGNRLDIQDCENDIQAMKDAILSTKRLDEKQEEKLQRLEEDLDEMKMYFTAIISVLRNKGLAAEAEIQSMVKNYEK
ncbi:MAG: hypothetical protein JXB10_03050 [Pirellulales bacterium]|nr:hypothetical protein [Pirellulales bacterium]